jgi:uncharacterized membrane protein
MAEQMSPQITDDDKLWSALAYVFTPLVPIILLLLEDKKDRPFIKAHNVQALIFGVVWYAIASILSFAIIGLCLIPIGWALQIYWGFFKAYQGEYVEIPVLTDFVKNQGWA